jgi:hypothetical protein
MTLAVAHEPGPAEAPVGATAKIEAALELEEREHRIVHAITLAYVTVGEELIVIQERGLYLLGYPTFEAYLHGRWNWSRRSGYAYIEAARVVRNVQTSAQSRGVQLSFSHAVEMARLSPEQQQSFAHVLAPLPIKQVRRAVRAILKKPDEIELAEPPENRNVLTGAEQTELLELVFRLPAARARELLAQLRGELA